MSTRRTHILRGLATAALVATVVTTAGAANAAAPRTSTPTPAAVTAKRAEVLHLIADHTARVQASATAVSAVAGAIPTKGTVLTYGGGTHYTALVAQQSKAAQTQLQAWAKAAIMAKTVTALNSIEKQVNAAPASARMASEAAILSQYATAAKSFDGYLVARNQAVHAVDAQAETLTGLKAQAGTAVLQKFYTEVNADQSLQNSWNSLDTQVGQMVTASPTSAKFPAAQSAASKDVTGFAGTLPSAQSTLQAAEEQAYAALLKIAQG